MKKVFLMLFVVTMLTYSQRPTTTYPYGMYVSGFSGLYSDASGMHHYSPAGYSNTLSLWNQQLSQNLFAVGLGNAWTSYFYDPTKYDLDGIISKSNTQIINQSWTLSGLKASGHYISITANTTDQLIFKTNSVFTILRSGNSYEVSAGALLNKTFASPPVQNWYDDVVVQNINIVGSDNNKHVIRPRDCNVIDANGRAQFYVKIYTSSSTSNQTTLRTKIFNNGGPSDVNINPLNSVSTLNIGTTVITQPFLLNPSSPTAYDFAMQLIVECRMLEGNSFKLDSIHIYDKNGEAIMENSNLTISDPSFRYYLSGWTPTDIEIMNNFNNDIDVFKNLSTTKPILIDLTDEAAIGNFRILKTVASYIRNRFSGSGKSVLICATRPEYWNNASCLQRYLSETSVDIIMPDIYTYNYSSIDIDTYKNWLIGHYSSLKLYTDQVAGYNQQYGKNIILYNIPQIHWWKNYWGEVVLQHPTYNCVLSNSYLSFLLNYKGILYFYAGFDKMGGQEEGEGLYKKDFTKTGQALYDYFGNIPANANTDLVSAVKGIGSFLNQSISEPGALTVGDLLKNTKVEQAKIIGYNIATGTYQNSMTFVDNELGTKATAEIIGIDLLDATTGAILPPTTKRLVGIARIYANNANYFIITNLNQDGVQTGMRLHFRSSNANRFLSLTTINDPTLVVGRKYPKNGRFIFRLAKDGALVLKVENVSPNETTEYPKGIRFGVLREMYGSTSIVCDTNFYSQGGLAEESQFSVSGTGYEYFSTDYDGNGGSDVVLFSKVVNSTTLSLTYKIYLQTSRAVFNTSSQNVTLNITKPTYSFRLQPMCIGTQLGYALYNLSNQTCALYYITQGGSLAKTNLPPQYFSNFYGSYSFQSNAWSTSSLIYLGKWNNNAVPFVYNFNQTQFWIDKNNNHALENAEGQPFGYSGQPFFGEWYGDNTRSEYGVYGGDNNWISQNTLLMNFTGTDGYTYFEFPYGMPGDRPFVWKLKPTSGGQQQLSTNLVNQLKLSTYPNPFNPLVNIVFDLPQTSFVDITVYDLLGRVVAVLAKGTLVSGRYNYRWNGNHCSSGIYFLIAKTENQILKEKLLLVK